MDKMNIKTLQGLAGTKRVVENFGNSFDAAVALGMFDKAASMIDGHRDFDDMEIEYNLIESELWSDLDDSEDEGLV